MWSTNGLLVMTLYPWWKPVGENGTRTKDWRTEQEKSTLSDAFKSLDTAVFQSLPLDSSLRKGNYFSVCSPSSSHWDKDDSTSSLFRVSPQKILARDSSVRQGRKKKTTTKLKVHDQASCHLEQQEPTPTRELWYRTHVSIILPEGWGS